MTDEFIGAEQEGWYKDPFRRHEDRWFSAGQPTPLVRDNGVESTDPPPARVKPFNGRLEHSEGGYGGPSDLRRADDGAEEWDPDNPDSTQLLLDVFPQITPGHPSRLTGTRPGARLVAQTQALLIVVTALVIFVGSLFLLHSLRNPAVSPFEPSVAQRTLENATTIPGPPSCPVDNAADASAIQSASVTAADADERITVHIGDAVMLSSRVGHLGPVLSGGRAVCLESGSQAGPDIIVATHSGTLTAYYFPVAGGREYAVGPASAVVEVTVVPLPSRVPEILYLIASALVAIALPVAVFWGIRRHRRPTIGRGEPRR